MDFGYSLDPGYIVEHLGELSLGLVWTVVLTSIGIVGGTLFGLVGGALRSHRVRTVSPLIVAGVEFIRTTPLFVQIFFLYFGLPEIGLKASGFVVASLALVIWGAAYNVENFRAAIEAVPKEYHEAARALGLKPISIFILVTLPVTIRLAIPSVTNTSVETLKNSALMLAISFPELTDTAVNLVAVSFRVFEVFITIGVVYLLLTAGLTRAMREIEHRIAWTL